MLGHIVWRKRWDPGALSPGPLGVVATSGISILNPPSPYSPPTKLKSFEGGERTRPSVPHRHTQATKTNALAKLSAPARTEGPAGLASNGPPPSHTSESPRAAQLTVQDECRIPVRTRAWPLTVPSGYRATSEVAKHGCLDEHSTAETRRLK